MKYWWILGLLVVMTLLAMPRKASAMTPFARNYTMPCSACHSPAPPRLNDFGRTFKENGYYMPGGKVFSPNELLELNEYPPIQVRLIAFLVSHQKSQPKATRTQFTIPSEADIQMATAFGPSFSSFAEVVTTTGSGGGASVGTATMDWHAAKNRVSVRAGNFQPTNWLDTSIGCGMRRLTRQGCAFEEHMPASSSLSGVQAIDSETAGFSIYGRPTPPLWVDVSVVEGDTANGQKDFWGHAAWRFKNKYEVHAFGYMGKVGATPAKYSRMGVGVNLPVAKALVTGAWSSEDYSRNAFGEGDLTNANQDAKYSTGYVGVTYPFTPRTYGDARWEFINSHNVATKENKNLTTVQLGYLIRLNVRTAVEFTADSKDSKNNILTWLVDLDT